MPNVFYEENGELKVGAVLAEQPASLHVETPHGRRSKVKAANVLLRFDEPQLAGFMEAARRIAETIDVDFLWQCCGTEEFSFEQIAREYFGRAPAPQEAAALLLKLHGAPMYFYKRGRGRYKPAPPEALRAALASIERKRHEAEKRARYVAELVAGRLPADFEPLRDRLLYRPDRASLEWKALEEACEALKLTPAQLFERCGALPSSHDYHLGRFLFEHFPSGTGFPAIEPAPPPADLPLAEVEAFSIDDVTTTEIDDAFSVERLADGGARVGIHIAAPALAGAPGSALDRLARERLSTVYYPGGKITMLPEPVIAAYTLAEGAAVPALSLYLELAPDLSVRARSTRLERVPIAQNLRHDALEQAFADAALAAGRIEHRFGEALALLWRLVQRLEQARGRTRPDFEPRPEYNFYVEGDRVRIVPRRRGTPVDRIVAELMIHVNGTWGAELAARGAAAIYRVQDAAGQVRMSTVPNAHEGLGLESYAWASSPLRRYVDLVNQRQLIALVRGEPTPYAPGDEALLAAMRDFESAHALYGEFQRTMERYWCLRWLLQERRETVAATVLRESLARLEELPLVVRVPSLPPDVPAGERVELAVTGVDLLELVLRCEFRRRLAPPGACG
jgi:exoribonuclease-2